METPGQRDLASFYARNATYGSTARYRRATRAEAYDLGFQYEQLPPHDTKGVPLRKKRPRILVPLFSEAIDALDGFVWSGGVPRVVIDATRDAGDDQAAGDVGPDLDVDRAKLLTRFAAALVHHGRLDRAAREISRSALVTTSVAVVMGVRGGRLDWHVEPGKHCTPTFDPQSPGELASLDICYQHQREEPTASGAARARWYWYRRTIDAERDTVYVEVPVVPGRAPVWTVDASKTVDHGLGFCPARWVRTLPDSSDPIDGRPVVDPQLYPLLDDVNYTISQRSKAVAAVVEPQIVRRGVPEGEREALSKSSDRVWDVDRGVEVELLEQEVAGIEAASKHLDDLTNRLRAAVRVVIADPKVLNGDISGRVLEIIHGPMIRVASLLRQDLGDDGFGACVALALRLVVAVIERGEAVYIPGAQRAAAVLREAQLAGPWLDPPITLHWKPFFALSEQEAGLKVDRTIKARDGKLIRPETAVRATAEFFGVADPEVELLEIEADEDERDSSMPPPPGEGDGAHDSSTPPPSSESTDVKIPPPPRVPKEMTK